MNISPDEKEIEYIRHSLERFNDAAVGPDGHTPLRITEYDKDGNVIGVLDIDSPEYRRFTPEDQAGLEAFAHSLEEVL